MPIREIPHQELAEFQSDMIITGKYARAAQRVRLNPPSPHSENATPPVENKKSDCTPGTAFCIRNGGNNTINGLTCQHLSPNNTCLDAINEHNDKIYNLKSVK
jgi:hypothetical protein